MVNIYTLRLLELLFRPQGGREKKIKNMRSYDFQSKFYVTKHDQDTHPADTKQQKHLFATVLRAFAMKPK